MTDKEVQRMGADADRRGRVIARDMIETMTSYNSPGLDEIAVAMVVTTVMNVKKHSIERFDEWCQVTRQLIVDSRRAGKS